MHPARQVLLLVLASAGFTWAIAAAETAEPIASVTELRAQRKHAAERQRRIIFNNDGNEPVYLCKDTTPGELLGHRTTALAGSQVDSLFYCTWSSGFGLFTHDTKVGNVFATKEALFSRNKSAEMLAAGTDPLRVMTGFGHAHGMEVFWSFRVNDTHDGSATDYGPVMFRANPLKLAHPEWLIGSPSGKPKFGAWSAVDFTRAEIRELAFRYVEEVCRNYEVDGVELDFFRHPVFFKRAAMTGTECSDDERALMSGLLRRIRAMTETEGMRRGRPILVAVRAPDSVEYSRASGLDLERWFADGLVDIFVAGGYFRLSPWSGSVALGHAHGVKVYASLDESRVRDEDSRKLRSSTAAYRGRALEAWQGGVDGVYLFNAFNPNNPIWRELGAPAALATMNRDHFASVLGLGAAAGGAYPHAGCHNLPRLNPAQPLTVKPGESARTTFDIGPAPAAGAVVVLRVRFKTAVPADAIALALNSQPLPAPEAKDAWLEFPVSPGALKSGVNEVQIALGPGAKTNAAVVTDLHCTVREPNAANR
jgi:hypothetical protein